MGGVLGVQFCLTEAETRETRPPLQINNNSTPHLHPPTTGPTIPCSDPARSPGRFLHVAADCLSPLWQQSGVRRQGEGRPGRWWAEREAPAAQSRAEQNHTLQPILSTPLSLCTQADSLPGFSRLFFSTLPALSFPLLPSLPRVSDRWRQRGEEHNRNRPDDGNNNKKDHGSRMRDTMEAGSAWGTAGNGGVAEERDTDVLLDCLSSFHRPNEALIIINLLKACVPETCPLTVYTRNHAVTDLKWNISRGGNSRSRKSGPRFCFNQPFECKESQS